MFIYQQVVIAASVVSFGVYMHAFYRYFTNPTRRNWKLRILQAINIINLFWSIFLLELVDDATLQEWSGALAAFIFLALIFRWTLQSAREAQLTLAFTQSTSVQVANKGPYRWIRHPIYTVYLIHWSVAPLMLGEWWAWIPPAAIFVLYSVAAGQEEAALLSGPLRVQYAEYRRNTGMFIPKIWRLGKK